MIKVLIPYADVYGNTGDGHIILSGTLSNEICTLTNKPKFMVESPKSFLKRSSFLCSYHILPDDAPEKVGYYTSNHYFRIMDKYGYTSRLRKDVFDAMTKYMDDKSLDNNTWTYYSEGFYLKPKYVELDGQITLY